jgi:5-(carboxyamino)imidazole ribonucleotide mutase
LTASAGIRWIREREEFRIVDFELRILRYAELKQTIGERRVTTMPKKQATSKESRGAKAEIRNPQSAIRNSPPLVAVLMGSKSDWDTMRHADQMLTDFGVPHECRVMSAHRSPALAAEFAANAESRGFEVVIAAAGGAAHLAGVMAAHTLLPVLGVPMKSDALNGLDSLLATVQMPGGIPVGTLAIGKAGALNAALLAVAILANSRPPMREKLRVFRAEQEKKIREAVLD